MALLPTLYTPRLTLRPFVLSDAPRVRELAGHPLVAATTYRIPHPYPAELAEAWIRTHGILAEEDRQYNFAITLTGTRTPGRESDLHDTGHLIGTVGLIRMPEDDPLVFELGYWIGVPYWNRGFATEAAHALLALGFGRMNLQRIFASHMVRNPASGRVLQKLGLLHEGTGREALAKDGLLLDIENYAINRQDWLAARVRPRFPASLRRHETPRITGDPVRQQTPASAT
jgi:ribosomal-protein-alanine N-acetyltransferase